MEYELIRSRRKSLCAEIKGNKLIIRAPLRAANEDISRFLSKNRKWIETHLAKAQAREQAKGSCHHLTTDELRALADKARKVIPARAAHYATLIGVTYGRITIRNQRTRWGSCSSKGNLNFNCLLMLMPPEIIDSIVAHELCHRHHMDHSAAFYAELARVCPDHRACRAWLTEHGPVLLARLGK